MAEIVKTEAVVAGSQSSRSSSSAPDISSTVKSSSVNGTASAIVLVFLVYILKGL